MANVGPLLRRRRVIAAKVEGTVGTAESLTATEAAFGVYDFEMQPTIPTVERAGQGFGFSRVPSVLGPLSGTSTFKADLFGGASAPAHLTTFLNACGMKLTSLTYTPESRPPEGTSSGAKTLTIGCYVDGVKKMLHGAMGNVTLHFPAGGACYAEYSFTGCWNAPTDVALLAFTPPANAAETSPLRFVSGALTVASYAPKVNEVVVNLNNVVTLRESGSAATGYHSAVVTDRRITITMDMEADLVANYDAHGKWLARTEEAIAWAIGATGNKLAFSCPKCQVIDVQPGERNGIEIFNVTYQANASDLTAAPGDDEMTIVSS